MQLRAAGWLYEQTACREWYAAAGCSSCGVLESSGKRETSATLWVRLTPAKGIPPNPSLPVIMSSGPPCALAADIARE